MTLLEDQLPTVEGGENVLASEPRLVEELCGGLGVCERGRGDGDLGWLSLDDLLCEGGTGLQERRGVSSTNRDKDERRTRKEETSAMAGPQASSITSRGSLLVPVSMLRSELSEGRGSREDGEPFVDKDKKRKALDERKVERDQDGSVNYGVS